MARSIAVRGYAKPAQPTQPGDFELLFGADLHYRVEQRVGATASSRQQAQSIEVAPEDAPDSDVLEVEDAEGLVTFHTVGSMRASGARRGEDVVDLSEAADLSALDLRGATTRRGGARGQGDIGRAPIVEVRRSSFSLPAAISTAVATLNASPVEQAVDALGRVVFTRAAKDAMKRIADWVDQPVSDDAPEEERRKRAKLPGVYRTGQDLLLHKDGRIDGTGAAGDAPHLLLVHGTFSNTEAAFAGFRGTPEWRSLLASYGDRVLALEHATLGRTPAQNALDAAKLLPAGSVLHLVSHSRGGLVGDVLSYASTHQPDLAAYLRTAPDHPDVEVLPELHRVLREREISVGRFVRVACPARGTTLASRRLDRYATYLFNVLRLVPGLHETGVAAVVQKLLLTLLDQRSDPRIVPGIEAQMPESPFIAMLNTAPVVADALGSIVGDIEGTGILNRLKVLGADLFFREDNDLVVNTSAMSAGVPRGDARIASFRGGEVSHTAYFANQASRLATAQWLAGGADVGGFSPVGATRSAAPARGAARGPARTPTRRSPSEVVVVVPDLLGTTIVEGEDPLWPDVAALAGEGVHGLLHARRGRAGELVENYEALVDRLSLAYEVRPYGYDWRRPLTDCARGLLTVLRSELGDPRKVVHVVTHGAGALVLLQACRTGSSGPEAFLPAPSRVVMLSPPLHGTWSAVARRLGSWAPPGGGIAGTPTDGRADGTPVGGPAAPGGLGAGAAGEVCVDRLCAALGMLAGTGGPAAVAEQFAKLPSFAALVPDGAPESGTTRTDPQGWRSTLLATGWAGWSAVYGRAVSTVSGTDPVTGGLTATTAGDGYVAYDDAPERGLSTWYAGVPHDALVGDPRTLGAVLDLLSSREPALASDPPVARPESFPIPDQRGGLLFPSSADLVWAALGAGVPVGPSAELPLQVCVVHGNLEAVDAKVIVGSIDGTPIGGAEEALDRRLQGALARHRLLNQYVGPLGTCQLFTRPGVVGPDAAVIGMGDAGDLTPPRLTAGVTQAVLRLAAAHFDASEDRDEPALSASGKHDLSVAVVLIGTLGSAPISVQGAVGSIVTGVRRANRRLQDLGQPVHVSSLQIVELFEDRAIDALRAALSLSGPNDAEDAPLVVQPLLVDGPGRRSGSPRSEYHSEQWRTVRVSAAPRGTSAPATLEDTDSDAAERLVELNFTVVGRGARAEASVTTGQRRLIDNMVEQSISNHNVDRQIYNTLYELLVPLSLKGQGTTSEHMMYILDDHAAQLPLEMLSKRSYEDGNITPLAVESGLVRRLETAQFRERVRPATGAKALVVGDPPTTRFQRLGGAIVEARAVADYLTTKGYEVIRQIPRDVSDFDSVDDVSIINSLFAHDYRIIHIAGHGLLDRSDPTRRGVLLGDETFLTAFEIAQMQTTPDLVFLNCCHLGAMQPLSGRAEDTQGRWRPDRFAAGIARELVDIGVRAVVAAGWAVDDDRACEFAQVFYEHMLDGIDLGTAALEARRRIWNPSSNDNTWGAYQVYGPPAFLLSGPHPGTRDEAAPCSRRDFRERIAALGVDAADADDAEAAAIGRRLQDLIAAAPDRWFGGDEWQRIGEVWRKLGDYDVAQRFFEQALGEWGADASLDGVEALVSVLVKGGAQLAAGGRHDEAEERFARAETVLSGLETVVGQEGPALLTVRASFFKHRLRCTGDQNVSEYLRLAYENFERAAAGYQDWKAGGQQGRQKSHGYVYATLNALGLGWLLSTRMPRFEFDACAAAARARECAVMVNTAPWASPFERLGVPDALLVEHLVTDTLRENRELVVGEYLKVFAAGTSRTERLTVIDHVDLLVRLVPGRRPALRDVVADLSEIRRRLEQWTPAQMDTAG
jgi:CHAT domain-containing protein